jgi:hypothetical protein
MDISRRESLLSALPKNVDGYGIKRWSAMSSKSLLKTRFRHFTLFAATRTNVTVAQSRFCWTIAISLHQRVLSRMKMVPKASGLHAPDIAVAGSFHISKTFP